MRRVPGTARAALVLSLTLVLALGASGCGGDDDGDTTAAEDGMTREQASGGGRQASRQNGEGGGSTEPSGEGSAEGFAAQVRISGAAESGSREAAPGVPTSRHGDNSIQLWGSEGSDSDRRAAAEALEGFFNARATGDVALMCAHVSPKLIADLGAQLGGAASQRRPSCPELLRFAVNPNADRSVLRAEARGLTVLSFRDGEEQGFVIYRDRNGEIWAFPMNKDSDGEWKVSLLGPSPIG